jgi:hypothetical protein
MIGIFFKTPLKNDHTKPILYQLPCSTYERAVILLYENHRVGFLHVFIKAICRAAAVGCSGKLPHGLLKKFILALPPQCAFTRKRLETRQKINTCIQTHALLLTFSITHI